MEIISWRLYLYELPNLYKLLNFSKIYSSIRADKISNKNIAEKSTKISLKTPSDFQSPSNHQELQSSTELHNECMFYKIPRKFAIKQANTGNLAEFLTNNEAKNINEIRGEN